MSERIARPLLRYHGGKYLLAPWIVSHLPPHRVYVEPFAGAASVLFAKSRSYSEVLNDLNDDIYNLFWVIQNHWQELAARLRITPYSRREFELSHVNHPDPIEKARRIVIRSFMGFGSYSASNIERSTGFRANSNRSGTTPAHDWVNYENHIMDMADRLRGVVIENRDWRECIKSYDRPETLLYLDPPYLPSTRTRVGAYRHELSEQDHLDLLMFAESHTGPVVLSGYSSPLYEERLSDWQRLERKAKADGARDRVEVLWIKMKNG